MTGHAPQHDPDALRAVLSDSRDEMKAQVPGSSAFRDHARSQSTVRAYQRDWSDFTEWCMNMQAQALPATPSTVAEYLVDRAGTLKPSTLNRRLVAIGHAHRAAGEPNPTKAPDVTETFKGIRRTLGTAPEQKAPITPVELRLMVETLDESLASIRNRALLLIGFAGAFRRSELAALNVEDLDEREEGYLITVRRSKTDQEGRGHTKTVVYGGSIPTCPVRSLARWLGAAGIDQGPIWRSVDRHGRVSDQRLHPASVSTIVKRMAADAQLDPERYAGHSLRAGFVTTAFDNGVSELRIAEQTGHRSLEVLRGYIRRDRDSLFRHSPAGEVGL